MKRVVTSITPTDEVLLENTSKEKGYVMSGRKGDYVLGRDVEGNYIWIRVTPGKTTKAVHNYSSVQTAIKAKLDKGFEVYEYSTVEFGE